MSNDTKKRMTDAQFERGCSCHLNPPCAWCESLTEQEAEIYWSAGTMAAIRDFRANNPDPNDKE
jgi:hypothetical protein